LAAVVPFGGAGTLEATVAVGIFVLTLPWCCVCPACFCDRAPLPPIGRGPILPPVCSPVQITCRLCLFAGLMDRFVLVPLSFTTTRLTRRSHLMQGCYNLLSNSWYKLLFLLILD
jgi:hypothetical protein